MSKRTSSSPLPDSLRAILTPCFPHHDLSRVIIHQSIPWYVRSFARVTPAAYTSGNNIHFAPGQYDPNSLNGITTIAHELTHAQQYSKYGRLRFQLKYLAFYLTNKRRGMGDCEAYEGIPFEREAYEKEREVKEYLKAQGMS
jgi:Domain of unknown function (DUF4157)